MTGRCGMADVYPAPRLLVVTDRPDPRKEWIADLRRHREVLGILTRKDFQTRYKRASLGVLWAVAMPLLQATVMAVVFSRVVRVGSGSHYPVYVISGVVAYTYFSTALGTASTAIVDGSGLTDKVWFPRSILVVVPCLSGLVGLAVTVVVLIGAMPLFGVHYTLRLLLIVPALALLITFTIALSLVLAALHVYFRDVKYLVVAALMVWLYVTPILYPQSLLGNLAPVMDVNPLTGIVDLFHQSTVGGIGGLDSAVAITLGVTAVLVVVAAEVQRRYDRLFVDLL
jgi:ABC-type polysaccharide/polyol phosphate export permease